MEKGKENGKNAPPVRVLHLIDRITGYGTTKFLWDIVHLTAPDKVKHLVITFSPDKGKFVYADRLREEGVYHQVPNPLFLRLGRKPTVWFLSRYISAFWHVCKSLLLFRPDIIHVHTGYVLTIGLPLKVVLRRPVVHLVPCLFSQMVDQGKGWVPKLYTRFHSLIDCFFIPAPRFRDELVSIGIPVSKIVPFYGQLDLQEINEVRNKQQEYHKAIRESLHLPSDGLIVLSVGRLDSSKGHIFALEALPALVRQFPKLHWILLGEGKERAELEDRARALSISPHVHLMGHQERTLPYYAAATVFLRTMIFEETNLSTYQAMAMGLPIVGFDTGCGTELIKKVGHGILVPNKNVEALATAVAQILMLPDQGRGIGGRGIEFSQANLDIRQTIKDMTTVYKNLKDGVDLKKNISVE